MTLCAAYQYPKPFCIQVFRIFPFGPMELIKCFCCIAILGKSENMDLCETRAQTEQVPLIAFLSVFGDQGRGRDSFCFITRRDSQCLLRRNLTFGVAGYHPDKAAVCDKIF